ncbi:MAG: Rho termination factor N-terminal domain-containing protein [Bacilli bacterium]
MKDIHDMTLVELKEMAKIKGIKGYSKLKKDELLEVLK